jgi:integrase
MPSWATGATSPEHPRVLLSKKQAAAALAMSVSHFERHVQGSLPCVRSGQLTLYPLRELELWADSHAALPRAPSALVGGPKRQSSHDGRRRTSDKRTRWPSLVVRHQVGCPAHEGKRCRCRAGYVARVWDPARRRPVSSPTFRTPSEGVAWQMEMRDVLKSRPVSTQTITVDEARDQFLLAIENGTALNKRDRPYKKSARRTIEGALSGRIEQELGPLPLNGVRRGQVQMLVDEMVAAGLSGSRVRNVLNALRSLYTYAIARELAQSSPITNVLLPAVGETPRDRVASPTEFRELLLALDPADAVPFALAGYATARSQEILNLTWAEIDWEANMVYLADEEEYAKSDSAKRPFPLIPQLRRILRPEWKRQGRPTTRQLVCTARKPRNGPDGGKLSTSALYTRADRAWDAKKLTHIRLHESRHTASSWLRAAGIDLKTRSVLMGHASTATTDKGRGSITDDRYTHLLPGEVERAGKRFAAYLTVAQTREA